MPKCYRQTLTRQEGPQWSSILRSRMAFCAAFSVEVVQPTCVLFEATFLLYMITTSTASSTAGFNTATGTDNYGKKRENGIPEQQKHKFNILAGDRYIVQKFSLKIVTFAKLNLY